MEPLDVVIAYSEALGKGDIPTAFSFFSPDVMWHQPGLNQFSGMKTGPNEIGKMIGDMMEASKGTFALNPDGNMMVNGNLVAMPIQFSGSTDGRKMEMRGIDLFRVEDSKIKEVWLFSENQVAEDEFWGK